MRSAIFSFLLYISFSVSIKASDSLALSTTALADSTHLSTSTTIPDSNGSVLPKIDSIKIVKYSSAIKISERSDTLIDSSRILLQRDSLLALESSRRVIFRPYTQDSCSDTIDAHAFFTADPTSWNDVSVLKQRFVAPRIGIANSMNRLLYYGNTAPVNHLYFGSRIIFQNTSDPLTAHDASFANEFSSITLSGNGALHFAPPAATLISPESVLFWENGVFGENIFSLRFTRPIVKGAIVNVFTNYRSFNGTEFDHDRNDVYTIFSNMTSDTTLLSHKGYNPLVNEFRSGAAIAWVGNTSRCNSEISYGDLTDEIALDKSPVNNFPVYAQLLQYPLTLQSSYSTVMNSRFYFDIEGRLETNHQRRPGDIIDSSATSETIAITTNDYCGAFRAGVAPVINDSIDGIITARYSKIGIPDSIGLPRYNVRPEVRWQHLFTFSTVSGNFSVATGLDLFASHYDTVYGLFWHADLAAFIAGAQMNCYMENDRLHLPPVYGDLSSRSFIHDAYLRTGINITRKWRFISLCTGYQFYPDPNDRGIARTWINEMPPYRQPQSTFLIASDIGRFFGCTLHSRIMLTDTRPSVKIHGMLSYHVLPELTHEAIDVNLGVDYWSKRDRITFAEKTDWNREVLDINVATSVHIKTFRIFYKIDNLLNRNFSYIPGYYSPGITFRWGFNWFIQR